MTTRTSSLVAIATVVALVLGLFLYSQQVKKAQRADCEAFNAAIYLSQTNEDLIRNCDTDPLGVK